MGSTPTHDMASAYTRDAIQLAGDTIRDPEDRRERACALWAAAGG